MDILRKGQDREITLSSLDTNNNSLGNLPDNAILFDESSYELHKDVVILVISLVACLVIIHKLTLLN
jgi:hypothetical protein